MSRLSRTIIGPRLTSHGDDMSDWVIRDRVPEDDNVIIYMFIRGLSGALGLGIPNDSFWSMYQPIVVGLLNSPHVETRVLCDPERSTYGDGPAVVWGWMIASQSTVYGLGIKSAFLASGIAGDMVKDLLGDRLEREQRFVLPMRDLVRAIGEVPPTWELSREWRAAMTFVSRARLDYDLEQLDVIEHIVNPHREVWVPRSSR